ncbi:hypothetical protein DQM43_15100 [Shigella dysenteriae]|nr:hypothetical protein [Shigella dysenteriae]
MITIRDVARQAGVSVATVSRVLNNSTLVSADTREAVMKAVSELDYRPNANAQALATQVSDTIGVVVMDVSDAFFGALVKAVDLVAQQHQKYVLIGNSYHEAEKERHAIEVLIRQRCNALIVHSFDSGFSTFAQGFVALGSFRLSYITFYALIAVAFVWVLWNKTRFGKNIFAIGGNPEAAKVSGVNVGLNLLMIYALSGVFYAFGGMLEAGRIGSATNNLGFMYELDAIAACVVGGVSFSGGVGTVIGVVTGVIIFTVINYGLTYIGVNPYWQYIIKGAIIIFAVALDSLKYARKK